MHIRSMLMSALVLVVIPVAEIHAQSEEAVNRVQRQLLYLSALDWIETTTGLQPAVAISLFVVLVLSIVGAVWVWLSRRKRD